MLSWQMIWRQHAILKFHTNYWNYLKQEKGHKDSGHTKYHVVKLLMSIFK